MDKRGQVALFIILGVIIVFVLGFIFFQRGIIIKETGSQETNEQFVSSRLEPIKTLVQNCVSESALKGLVLIGKQGGYYDPVRYESLSGFNVSYGCYKINNEYVNLIPLVSKMNEEFKRYMASSNTKKDLEKCIDNFNDFKQQGLNVKDGELSFDSNILENKVTLTINYPLEITKSDYTATINSMIAEVPVGLGRAHKIAVEIANTECSSQEFDFDSLGLGDPTVTSSVQGYNGNKIVYLKTIPIAPKEIPIDFDFIIQQ